MNLFPFLSHSLFSNGIFVCHNLIQLQFNLFVYFLPFPDVPVKLGGALSEAQLLIEDLILF